MFFFMKLHHLWHTHVIIWVTTKHITYMATAYCSRTLLAESIFMAQREWEGEERINCTYACFSVIKMVDDLKYNNTVNYKLTFKYQMINCFCSFMTIYYYNVILQRQYFGKKWIAWSSCRVVIIHFGDISDTNYLLNCTQCVIDIHCKRRLKNNAFLLFSVWH